MRGIRRLSAFPVAAEVYGDAEVVEDHHVPGCDANVGFVAGQRVGNAVEGLPDLDVIADVDAGPAPLGELVALRRERRAPAGPDPRTSCAEGIQSSGTTARLA